MFVGKQENKCKGSLSVHSDRDQSEPPSWLAAFIPVEENPSEPGVGHTPLILHSGGRDRWISEFQAA
ncbi:mCG1041506 [Mus musculus]|jgi:hypothetical protein|nr:mCG1041506 [Mus musculus]